MYLGVRLSAPVAHRLSTAVISLLSSPIYYRTLSCSFPYLSSSSQSSSFLSSSSSSPLLRMSHSSAPFSSSSSSSPSSPTPSPSNSLGSDVRLGVIGAGNMANAILMGLVSSSVLPSSQISVSDPYPDKLNKFRALGMHTTNDNLSVLKRSNVILLAVKPNVMVDLLNSLRPHVTPSHLFVSLAAGVSIKIMAKVLPPSARIVRVMSNTPALVGYGASAYALGQYANERDGTLVHRLLSTVGKAVACDEKGLDAVTGLSGSGPAYVFIMAEAMADGGVRAGLPRDVSQMLAIQTILGSAKMMQETAQHPAALKDAVASPGGTTIAGIQQLEEGGFRGSMMKCVVAATNRSAELAAIAEKQLLQTSSDDSSIKSKL